MEGISLTTNIISFKSTIQLQNISNVFTCLVSRIAWKNIMSLYDSYLRDYVYVWSLDSNS